MFWRFLAVDLFKGIFKYFLVFRRAYEWPDLKVKLKKILKYYPHSLVRLGALSFRGKRSCGKIYEKNPTPFFWKKKTKTPTSF